LFGKKRLKKKLEPKGDQGRERSLFGGCKNRIRVCREAGMSSVRAKTKGTAADAKKGKILPGVTTGWGPLVSTNPPIFLEIKGGGENAGKFDKQEKKRNHPSGRNKRLDGVISPQEREK